MAEQATFQEPAKFSFDEGGHAAVPCGRFGQKGLEVFLHDRVEERILGCTTLSFDGGNLLRDRKGEERSSKASHVPRRGEIRTTPRPRGCLRGTPGNCAQRAAGGPCVARQHAKLSRPAACDGPGTAGISTGRDSEFSLKAWTSGISRFDRHFSPVFPLFWVFRRICGWNRSAA